MILSLFVSKLLAVILVQGKCVSINNFGYFLLAVIHTHVLVQDRKCECYKFWVLLSS